MARIRRAGFAECSRSTVTGGGRMHAGVTARILAQKFDHYPAVRRNAYDGQRRCDQAGNQHGRRERQSCPCQVSPPLPVTVQCTLHA